MITCKFAGRTGNNLFQMAAAIGHALNHGFDYRFPKRKPVSPEFERFVINLPQMLPEDQIEIRYQEEGHPFQRLPIVDNLELNGFFQSEKYFAGHREKIIKCFGFEHTLEKGTVAVHVRRGDYLNYPQEFPFVGKKYLLEAMEQMGKGFTYVFFSDDIAWCKDNFHGDNIRFTQNQHPLFDIERISNCEHQIISNSSFSWWGAWLNQNQNKKVIAPKVWFGPANDHLDTRDVVPENWIKI